MRLSELIRGAGIKKDTSIEGSLTVTGNTLLGNDSTDSTTLFGRIRPINLQTGSTNTVVTQSDNFYLETRHINEAAWNTEVKLLTASSDGMSLSFGSEDNSHFQIGTGSNGSIVLGSSSTPVTIQGPLTVLNTIITDEILKTGNGLIVDGDTILGSDFSNNTTINGTLKSNNDLIVVGNTVLGNDFTYGTTINGNLSANNNVLILGNLQVDGAVNTNLSATGKIYATTFRANQGSPDSADTSTKGFAFERDGDTGLFSPIVGGAGDANGTLGLFTNNVERVRISENVGIGTSVPNEKLTVIGNISATGNVLGENIVARMPEKTSINVSRIGFLDGYLGLDVKSEFLGSAVTPNSQLYAFKEHDGSLVGLRPGTNGDYSSLYYFYTPTTNFNDDNFYITDTQYSPSWLDSGETVFKILGNAGRQGFCVRTQGSTSRTLWVNLNGTMDHRFHSILYDLTSIAGSSDKVTYCETPDGSKKIFVVVSSDLKGYINDPTPILDGSKNLKFKIYNANNLTQPPTEFDFGLFDLSPNTIIDFGTYFGSSCDTVYFDRSSEGELHSFALSNNEIIVSRNTEITSLGYGTREYTHDVNFNSVIKINVTDPALPVITHYYPLSGGKYLFDPNIDANLWVPPFFKNGNYFDNGKTTQQKGQILFIDVGDNEFIELSKGEEINNLNFFVTRHQYKTGKSFQDLVLTPYYASNPVSIITHHLQLIPQDTSLVGKKNQGVLWATNTKLLCQTFSKVYPSTSISNNTISTILPSFSSTEPWYNGSVIGLKKPIGVNASENVLSGVNLHLQTVIESSTPDTITIYKQNGNNFVSINPATEAIINVALKPLPIDWSTQLDSIIDTNVPTAITGIILADFKKIKHLYYLKNDLFLLTFNLTNLPGLTSRSISCCCLVELIGNNFNYINLSIKILTDFTNFNGSLFLDTMSPRNYTCSLYDYSPSELYALFTCGGGRTTNSGSSFVAAIKVNPNSKTITNIRRTSELAPTQNETCTGIHSFYGAYVTQAFNNSMSSRMNYFNSTQTTQVLKIKDTFDQWLAGTEGLPEPNKQTLNIFSIRPAANFTLYSLKTPIFLKGVETAIPTKIWSLLDPNNWLNGSIPSTAIAGQAFHVYIALSKNQVTDTYQGAIKYSTTRVPDLPVAVHVGLIYNDLAGVILSELYNTTKVANTRINEIGDMSVTSIILTSPGGINFKVTIDDSGSLTTSQI
jgi:hypothetical protein